MTLKERFKKGLTDLGVKSGDNLMIHSSYKALGEKIEAKEVFEAILEVLGKDGTLIMPAFSYSLVTYEQTVFDKEETPSCVGFLPEYFRTEVDGVKRSLHATHSCCVIGKNSEYFIKDHELDATPVGENSPLAKLPKMGGKILILGSHPDHNTALHGVEEKAGAPYPINRERVVNYTLKEGDKEIIRPSYRHDFHKADCEIEQKYERIIPLLSEEEHKTGKILCADSHLMSAAAVWEKGVAAIKKDPLFFVNIISKA